MNILVIDDSPERGEEIRKRTGGNITTAITKAQILVSLQLEKYDVIFLDHDLGMEDWNGVGVASLLVELFKSGGDRALQTIIIQSLNSAGAAAMHSVLSKEAAFDTFVIPFAWQKLRMEEGNIVFDF